MRDKGVTAIPVQRRLVQGSPDRADKKGLLPSPEVRLVQESPKKKTRGYSRCASNKERKMNRELVRESAAVVQKIFCWGTAGKRCSTHRNFSRRRSEFSGHRISSLAYSGMSNFRSEVYIIFPTKEEKLTTTTSHRGQWG